jgi:hypothetical protein
MPESATVPAQGRDQWASLMVTRQRLAVVIPLNVSFCMPAVVWAM